MKNILLLISLAIMLGLSITSCEKEEDDKVDIESLCGSDTYNAEIQQVNSDYTFTVQYTTDAFNDLEISQERLDERLEIIYNQYQNTLDYIEEKYDCK